MPTFEVRLVVVETYDLDVVFYTVEADTAEDAELEASELADDEGYAVIDAEVMEISDSDPDDRPEGA